MALTPVVQDVEPICNSGARGQQLGEGPNDATGIQIAPGVVVIANGSEYQGDGLESP
jgi:hypothetical protein